MWIFFALQVASPQEAPSPPPAVVRPSAPVGELLWRDFRVGMSPEETASALLSVEGVSEAVVKRDRKSRFKGIDVKYSQSGVQIGDMQVTLAPVFERDKLQEFNLVGVGCAKAATERMKLLRDSLQEKYGHFARERVVDENGVEFEQRAAFWNDETRVRMSWRVEAPNTEYYSSSGRGVQGALAGLANLMAQSDRDSALAACPDDSGMRVHTTLNYTSQSRFLTEHAAEIDARNKKAQATRDAL